MQPYDKPKGSDQLPGNSPLKQLTQVRKVLLQRVQILLNVVKLIANVRKLIIPVRWDKRL
jgi:hypothetical protein